MTIIKKLAVVLIAVSFLAGPVLAVPGNDPLIESLDTQARGLRDTAEGVREFAEATGNQGFLLDAARLDARADALEQRIDQMLQERE